MRQITFAICVLFAVGIANADWSENFDSYAAGSLLIGQGGWEGWDGNPGADAVVSSAQAQSSPNSVSAIQTTDIVQQFTGVNSGIWSMSASCYIPAGSTGTQYFILLNIYNSGGPYDWSMSLKFNSTNGEVSSEEGTGVATLVYDQWVPIEIVFDLGANLQTVYYNNVQIDQLPWTSTGELALAALDLFGNGGTPIFWDDIVLEPSFALNQSTWGQIKATW